MLSGRRLCRFGSSVAVAGVIPFSGTAPLRPSDRGEALQGQNALIDGVASRAELPEEYFRGIPAFEWIEGLTGGVRRGCWVGVAGRNRLRQQGI
jgi:hypothetical protein